MGETSTARCFVCASNTELASYQNRNRVQGTWTGTAEVSGKKAGHCEKACSSCAWYREY